MRYFKKFNNSDEYRVGKVGFPTGPNFSLVGERTIYEDYMKDPKLVLEISDTSITKYFPSGTYGLSGIAWLGDDSYAIVDDAQVGFGFHEVVVVVENGGINLRYVSYKNQGSATDQEGIAFDSQNQRIWISQESNNTISEMQRDGSVTARTIDAKRVYGTLKSNYGLEGLTFSGNTNLLWSINERPSNGADYLRLQAWNTATLEPVGYWKYYLDEPQVSVIGDNYAHGVSALAALPDGRILTLEREGNAYNQLSLITNPLLAERCVCHHKIYMVGPQNIIEKDKVEKKLVTEFTTKLLPEGKWANYEGMCLGKDNKLFLISDSQKHTGGLEDYIRVYNVTFE